MSLFRRYNFYRILSLSGLGDGGPGADSNDGRDSLPDSYSIRAWSDYEL